MRRLALGLAAALTFAAPVLAAEPAPTILHLEQTAERTVPRDRLTVELRTEAVSRDPRTVQAEINRRMAAALEKAKSVATVKAASGTYETYRVTPPDTGDGKPKPPPQWRSTQTLTLSGRDFAKALTLAGQLQADGMLISDMRFDVAPETLRAQQQALTDEALAALTARAGRIAATLGLTVARIQTLNVGNATQPGGGPRPLFAMRAAADAPAPAPAVAAGDAAIAVTVNAEIALAAAR